VLPKQGSLTFVSQGSKNASSEPKYLDLTHLGPKHGAALNIKLPQVNTQGESFVASRLAPGPHMALFTLGTQQAQLSTVLTSLLRTTPNKQTNKQTNKCNRRRPQRDD
jgi:hypothetical protein